MNEIELPWPNARLSPNARVHWAARTAVSKRARNDARWILRSSGLRIPAECRLEIEFIRSTRIRFDLDNALASLKWALDGLARESGCDDAGWSFEVKKSVDRATPGKGVVKIRWAD